MTTPIILTVINIVLAWIVFYRLDRQSVINDLIKAFKILNAERIYVMLFTTKTDKNVEIGRALANFDTACRDLVNLVNDQLFESSRSPYWVADEVGGICDFGDTDFLTPEEMVLILKHGVSYDDYVEWREANIKYGDTKGRIKLKSWLRGCRHDQSLGLLAMPTTPTMPIGPNINSTKKLKKE